MSSLGRRWFPASLQEIRQWCVQLAALCGGSSGNIIRTVCDVHAGPGDYTEASNPAKRQSQETDVMFVHDREKFFHVFLSKKQYFILLHLSTASGSQKSSSMIFQRKSIPDLWIAVQSIWNFMEISPVFCTVIHRHNDERETAARWRKLYKSGTMNS